MTFVRAAIYTAGNETQTARRAPAETSRHGHGVRREWPWFVKVVQASVKVTVLRWPPNGRRVSCLVEGQYNCFISVSVPRTFTFSRIAPARPLNRKQPINFNGVLFLGTLLFHTCVSFYLILPSLDIVCPLSKIDITAIQELLGHT